MKSLKMSPQFSVDPDKINSNNSQAYNKADSTASTLFFYFRDSLNAPSGMMNKIKTARTSKAGKILRKECFCPKEIQNLPDSFFECLEASEKEYDFATIVQMWKSIGVSLKIEPKIPKNKKATIMDVLNETMDTILVPVISPANKRNDGFTISSCLISNSGLDAKRPTLSKLSIYEKLSWGKVVENAVWTCSSISNDIDGKRKQFPMKYRLHKARIKNNSQRWLSALAESLSYGGIKVWVCTIDLPETNMNAVARNKKDPSFKVPKISTPEYKWEIFNPNNPVDFFPIEPIIVRDFVEHGDRNISLRGINGDKKQPDYPMWEIDEMYNPYL